MLNIAKTYSNRINHISFVENWSIILLLFFIPISPAAPNILAILLIILWLLKGQYKQSITSASKQPIFWAFLLYLIIYPLSILWSANQEWALHLTERHMIYLLFPFLFMAIKKEYFKHYIIAFIAGLAFTEFVSYLMLFNLIDFTASASPTTPFYTTTLSNPLLAWGIYLLMYLLLFEKSSLLSKTIIIFLTIAMTISLLITGGRGGQLAYFIIIGILFLQYFHFKGNLLKGFILGSIFIATIFTLAYQTIPLFKDRVNLAITEVKHYTPEATGSVGVRIHMYINTSSLAFNRHWSEIIAGSGIGDFPEQYTQYAGGDNAVFKLEPNTTGHSHPHNMFLYQLGALGLLGLFSLLWIFQASIKVALKENNQMQYYQWAFIVYIIAINITDSLLLSHPTALLFIAFSAILFKKYSQEEHRQ